MRISRAPLEVLLLCLLAPTLQLPAQSIILPKISFTGAAAYSQADLLTVSGLKPGATSTPAAIQAGAQRISDTGLFADIRFESTAAGLIFHLKPMPAENILPAQFTNFIWWKPAELTAELKSRVPLFIGAVPPDGKMQDQVIAALKALLAERKITAEVVAMPSVPTGGGTPTAITFAIDTPKVVVRSLTLQQVSPTMQPKLAAAIKNLADKPYVETVTTKSISDQIGDVYRNNGYLDIALTSLTHADPQITPDAINLDLTATFNEGEPYHLTSLTWAGSEVMSTETFNKFAKLKPEDIASQLALRQSLAALGRAYFAKGFQDAKIQAPATIDRATHHVAYTVTVVPGPQYHLHTIKVIGLTDEQRKQFDAAWHMNAGDLYDTTYMTGFLTNKDTPPLLHGISATYRAVSDPDTHFVDLAITFVKGGTLIEVH
jgi:outer membrane protein assembly factor BamA